MSQGGAGGFLTGVVQLASGAAYAITNSGGGIHELGGGGAAGTNAASGLDGTGGGGGGKSCNNISNLARAGNGGSGIVIVRYVAGASALSPYEQWQRAYFTTQDLANSAISGDNADPDHDGMSNLAEYQAGTIPTNSASCLVFTADGMNPLNAGQFIVRWQSATNKHYTLQATTNLTSGFNLILGTNIVATPPENVHTDNVGNVGQKFYPRRVRRRRWDASRYLD